MKNIIGIHFMLFSILSFAQGIDRRAEFAPASPNAAEIMRYGLVPVDQYTGIPDINVPLYEMDFDGKKIPIALRYHAGGIRTDQEASWVGLGWSLTATPVISRTINYKSDIGQGRRLPIQPIYNTGAYCYNPTPNSPTFSSTFESAVRGYNNQNTSVFDQMDTQPDIFIASLFGETVKFQLTQKATTTTIKSIILNDSKATVRYLEDPMDFSITDEQGFEYRFTHKEFTTYLSHTPGVNTSLPDDVMEFDSQMQYSRALDAYIITSWFLDKLISPNGKVLDFGYLGDPVDESDLDDSLGDIHISISPTSVFESANIASCQDDDVFVSGTNIAYTYQRSLQENKYLQEIVDTSTGERLVFHVADRDDMLGFGDVNTSGITAGNFIYPPGDYNPPKRLTGVDIHSPTGKVVKKIRLGQTYFNSDDSADSHPDKFLRLKLDDVRIDNAIYSFEYRSPNALPDKTTKGRDFWGFYNGMEGQRRSPTQLLDGSYPIGLCNAQAMPSSDIVVTGGLLGSSFDYGRIGILEKMVYPTGGATLFSYESNTAVVSSDPTSDHYSKYSSMCLDNNDVGEGGGYPRVAYLDPDTKTYRVGGLRIASIENRDSDNTLLLKKSYRYEGLDSSTVPMSSGRLMNELFYYYPVELFDTGENHIGTTLVSTSSNKVYGNNAAQGSHVGYGMVEETIVDADDISKNNGRTVTTYRNEPNIGLSSTYMGNGQVSLDAPPLSFEAGNGKIVNQKIYGNVFGSLPKREVTNIYDFKELDVAPAYKLYFSNMTGVIVGGSAASGTPIGYSVLYDRFDYKVKRTYADLTQSIVTDRFDNGNTVSNTTIYTHNDRPQLKSITSTSSKGPSTKKEFYYPYDTAYGVNSHSLMNNLVLDNRIGSPVYTRNFFNNKLLQHELLTYKNENGLLVPAAIFSKKEEATLANLEKRMEYLEYDEVGNPLKLSWDNGPVTEYVWGYEKKYPIAKITNVETVATPVGDILDVQKISDPRSPDSVYRSEMDKVRNHGDYSGSMVTTYTYDPLVGVTGITDMKDLSSSFGYDDRERLEEERDHNGLLVSEYDYRLINETTDCLEDCATEIGLSTNKYGLFKDEPVTITYSLTGSFSISNWRIYLGDGTILEGQGVPSVSSSHSYEEEGLKIIRLFLYNAQGQFLTANVNVRVFSGTIPGSDVYLGNIQTVSSRKQSAFIYGDPGSIVTYIAQCGGSNSTHSGLVTVNGIGTSVNAYVSETRTVTIPSTGYVTCSVEHNGSPSGGSGSTSILLSATNKGQVVSPSSISASCCGF